MKPTKKPSTKVKLESYFEVASEDDAQRIYRLLNRAYEELRDCYKPAKADLKVLGRFRDMAAVAVGKPLLEEDEDE